VDANAEAWNTTAKPFVEAAIVFDRLEHRIDGAQHSLVPDRRCPAPCGNQPIAFVEVEIATEIGNRLRHIGQKFAHERAGRERPKRYAECSRIIDIEKEQDLSVLHGTIPWRPHKNTRADPMSYEENSLRIGTGNFLRVTGN
jgi:hypothetical protein